MKTDPSLDLIEDIRDTDRGRAFYRDIRLGTERDDHDRAGVLEKWDHYRARRYCMEDRDPSYPWPGSSSIVLPFIDKKIDEMKPLYVSLVADSRPPCTALAVDPDSQRNVANIELFEQWLVHFGSPEFLAQVTLCVDDLLEKGRGILKTVWHYSTVRCAQMLDRTRLPEKLRKLIVAKDVHTANLLHLLTGGPQNGGPAVLDQAQFNEMLPQIKGVLRQHLGLDADDPDDREAVNQVLGWLKRGARDPIRVDSNQVRDNVPGVVAVDPKNLIMPSYARASIESVERYSELMTFTRMEMEQRARDGQWNKEAVKRILENNEKGADRSPRKVVGGALDQALREGVSALEQDTYEVYETYGWYSRGPGQPARKTKIVWSDASPDVPLRFTEYVRPSGNWPHHSAVFEMNKDRWYSARGIPEKLDDIDWEITHQHRYKLNRAMIATAPTVVFNPNGIVNPETWRHIPGQMMPARNPAQDARVLEYPQLDVVFEREEQVLVTWGDQYMGGQDWTVNSPLSRLSEAPTATQVNSVDRRARQALSLRGLLFQKGIMQPVYREMLDLFLAHGDDSIYIRVTDSDPVKLSKEDLRGQFVLQCTGTIGEQDPASEEQRALQRIMVLNQVGPLLGSRYELKMDEAVRDWLEKSDIRLAKLILRRRTDEEVQQIEQQKQEQQAQMALMAAQGGGPKGRPAQSPAMVGP